MTKTTPVKDDFCLMKICSHCDDWRTGLLPMSNQIDICALAFVESTPIQVDIDRSTFRALGKKPVREIRFPGKKGCNNASLGMENHHLAF